MQEVINLNIDNYLNKSKKKNEWWIWVFASMFILSGLALSISSLCLLVNSYASSMYLAAYAGAIGSGLTLSLAGLTQILVFIHRVQDEKAKKLDNVVHDYTNFFIKNYHWNEMISLIFLHINKKLDVTLKFDEKRVVISYSNSISNFKELRRRYLYLLTVYLYKQDLFVGMLKDKYNFDINHKNISKAIFNAYSAFDTEIKKSAMSVEKILQAKQNHKYEDEFYNFNMKERIKNYSLVIMPYFLIIIHDNQNFNFAAKAIDLLPFMMYYLGAKD